MDCMVCNRFFFFFGVDLGNYELVQTLLLSEKCCFRQLLLYLTSATYIWEPCLTLCLPSGLLNMPQNLTTIQCFVFCSTILWVISQFKKLNPVWNILVKTFVAWLASKNIFVLPPSPLGSGTFEGIASFYLWYNLYQLNSHNSLSENLVWLG